MAMERDTKVLLEHITGIKNRLDTVISMLSADAPKTGPLPEEVQPEAEAEAEEAEPEDETSAPPPKRSHKAKEKELPKPHRRRAG